MWMPPEVLSGRHNVAQYGKSADVYSTAIVVWQILALEPLFPDLTLFEIIRGVTSGNLRPRIPNHWSPAIKSVLENAWKTDASSRPTARQMKRIVRKEIRRLQKSGHDTGDTVLSGMPSLLSSLRLGGGGEEEEGGGAGIS